jgi:pentose-5-phosphate-3-epimerase
MYSLTVTHTKSSMHDMHILPSTLEYSRESLEQKLRLVSQNLDNFHRLQGTSDVIKLHIDVVMRQFAQDRSVMASVDLVTNLELIEQYFADTTVELTIHLMGTAEDLKEAHEFLQKYTFNLNWTYIIFIPEAFVPTFEVHSLLFDHVRVGIWYDKGEWSENKCNSWKSRINDYLLMTVYAGKSGQKRSDDDKAKAITLAQSFPDKYIVVDGGWQVGEQEELQDFQTLDMVSYSSFWKQFLEM